MFKRFRKTIQDATNSPARSGNSNSDVNDVAENMQDETSGFICPMCMGGFSTPDQLQIHFDSAHGDPEPVKEISNTEQIPVVETSENENGDIQSKSENKENILNAGSLHASMRTPERNLSLNLTDDQLSQGLQKTLNVETKKNGEGDGVFQQEISDLEASLQEEKWYSEELKVEYEKIQAQSKSQKEEYDLIQQQMTIAIKTNEDLAREKEMITQKLALKCQESAELQSACDELKGQKQAQVEMNQNQSVELEKAATWIRDLESQLVQRPGADDVLVLKKELVSVQTLMDQLTLDSEKQKEVVQGECEILKERKDSLQEKYDTLKSEHEKMLLNSENSQALLHESVQKKASETNELTEKHSVQLEKLQEDLENLQTALEKEQQHSQTVEIENNQLQGEVLDIKQEKGKIEGNMQRLSEEMSKDKSKIKNIEQKILEVENSKVQVQVRLDEVLEEWKNACIDSETKLTEKDARIESLTRQYEDAFSELSIVKKDFENVSSHKTSMQDDYGKLREDCQQYELEKSLAAQRHESELNEIKIVLTQSNDNNSQLQNRIEVLEEEAKQYWNEVQQERSTLHSTSLEKEKQIMQMEMNNRKLQDELMQSKNRNEELESKESASRAAMQDMMEKLKSTSTENLSNIQKVQTLERSLAKTNAALASEVLEREAVAEEVKRLQQERNDLMGKMEVGEGQAVLVGQLNDENESLRNRLDELDSKCKDQNENHGETVKEYESQLMEIRATIQEQQEVIEVAHSKIKNLDNTVFLLQEKDTQSMGDLEAKGKQVMELQENLSGQKVNFEGQVSILQRSVEDKTRECEKFAASVDTLKSVHVAAMEQAEKSRTGLQERLNQLQEDNCRNAIQLKDLKENLTEKNSTIQELRVIADDARQHQQQESENLKLRHAEKVAVLESELKSSQQQNFTNKSELEMFRMQKIELDVLLKDSTRKLQSAEAENTESSQTIVNLRNELDNLGSQMSESERNIEKNTSKWKNEKAELEGNHETSVKNLKEEYENKIKLRKNDEKARESESNLQRQQLLADLQQKMLLLESENQKSKQLEKNLSAKEELLTNLQEKFKVSEEDLENRCKEMTGKCDELEAGMKNLKSENEDILAQIALKEEMCLTQASTLNELRGKLEERDQKIKEVYVELGKTSSSFKESDEKLAETSMNLKESQEMAERVKNEVARLDAVNTELKSSLEISNSTIDGMANNLDATKKELEDVKSALQERVDELGLLNLDLSNKQEKWTESNQNLTSESEKWKSEALQTAENLEKERNTQKEESQLWETTKYKMERELEVKESEWTKEKEELLQSQETLKGAQQILINSKMEMQKQLEKANQEMAKEKEKLTDMEASHQEQISASEVELKELRADFEKTSENLRAAQDEKQKIEARMQLEVSTLRENLDSVRAEWQAAVQQADKMNNDCDELKGQVVVLQATVQNNADERRALLERCIIAEQSVEQLKAMEGQLKRRLDDAQAAMHELGRENQAMQVKHTSVLSRQWAEDREAVECSSCRRPFSLTLRKHHCRHCGLIFCADCSSKATSIASSKKPVRVCEKCFDDLLTVQ